MELVEHLACRQDFFVAAFMAAVGEVADYRNSAVTPADLRQTAADSFRVLTDSLRNAVGDDPDAQQRLVATARELAARRIDQGIQLDSVIHAIHIDFTVLWTQLKGIARPEDAPVLVELAEPVWKVVDDYASAVYGAFLEIREAQARHESAMLQQHLLDLFVQQPTPNGVTTAASALGLTPHEPLMIVAIPTGTTPGILRELAHPCDDPHTPCHALTIDACDIVLFPAHAQELILRAQHMPCVLLGPIAGLGELWRERSRITTLTPLMRASDQQALTPSSAWARLAASANSAVGNDLSARLATALATVRPIDAERIQETVQTFLRTGSVRRTAAETYCHRNTVLNHLHRFAELTGLDVTRPEQAAMVVIAWS